MARTKKTGKKEVKVEKSVAKKDKKDKKDKMAKKSMEAEQGKKKRKRRFESYGLYLYKVLKQVHEDVGISRNAMGIMNDFMNDIFERIANEASILSKSTKTRTLSSRDVMAAVELIFRGELARHALHEGNTALARYNQSYGKGNEKRDKNKGGNDTQNGNDSEEADESENGNDSEEADESDEE